MTSSRDVLHDPSYRLGIGMLIVNHENKIFVGQRIDKPQAAWQMPQGGVDEHENPDQAMIRELEEEIGTTNVEVIVKSKKFYQYDLPSHLRENLWNGKFKGQKQIWYALRFKGSDKDVNIHTSDPEFCDWKWVDKNRLLDLIVPFKKDLYIQVIDELWPFVLKSS
jgi:putative (di)nucleoside polyphosphate hydrolase